MYNKFLKPPPEILYYYFWPHLVYMVDGCEVYNVSSYRLKPKGHWR